jgi:hypothetical protein
VNTGEDRNKNNYIDRNPLMKLGELIIVAAFGIVLIFALTSCPVEDLGSFNPVEWFADSIKGFFDWFINLFFGWI